MRLLSSLLLAFAVPLHSVLAAISSSPPHCLASAPVLSSLESCLTSKTSSHEIHTSIVSTFQPILIDLDEHDPRPHFPWTHKPICYIVVTDGVPKLCIYTNASFSNGRGISIFTTPSLAKEFAQLSAFIEPSSLSQANSYHRPPTYVKSIPGKGKGMFASRDLKRGELITTNTPLLVVYREEVLSSKDREFYLGTGVHQLNRKSRALYYGMATIYGDERVKTQDVLKANTFGLEIGGMEHCKFWLKKFVSQVPEREDLIISAVRPYPMVLVKILR